MNKQFWTVNSLDQFTAEVYLYGYICYESTAMASGFVKELRGLEKKYPKIDMRINSNGGSVYECIAILHAMEECQSEISAYIDGIAASMAGVIFLNAPKRYMNKYARLMTHKVKAGCHGTASQLRSAADEVESLENDLAAVMSQRTKLSLEDTRAKYITDTDRYLTAEQAKNEGLIDSIYNGSKIDVPTNIASQDDVYGLYSTTLNASLSTNNTKTIVII